MSDSAKNNLLGDLGLSKEETMKAVVSALALIHEARQAALSPEGARPPSAPVKDVLSELARLHAGTIGQLAKINADYTDKMVDFLRKRRAAQVSGRPVSQALVVLKMQSGQAAEAPFCLKNEANEARTYRFPEIIEFTGLQDDKPGAFVQVAFFVSRGNPISSIEIPGRTSDGPAVKEVRLCVNQSDLLGPAPARFRARVLLDGAGVPTVELIVELMMT